MILIFSPTPFSQQSSDGFLSRALCIDNIIKDYSRCYVELYYEPNDFLAGPNEIVQNNNCYKLNLAALAHQSFFIKLVLKADLLYAHSLYNVQFLMPFLATKPFILDLHGVVPEENALYQRQDLANYYRDIEEFAVNKATRIVSVSQAMSEHYQNKYKLPIEKLIEIPHVDINTQIITTPAALPSIPTIMYSGGTQNWQLLHEVIDFINSSGIKFNYIFLTPNIPDIKIKITNTACQIEYFFSQKKQDLEKYYLKAQFGFMLRTDNIVNQVACPTKIIDYLQFGIIPIIKTAKIGDFERLGLKYVLITDLDQVYSMTADTLLTFKKQNIEVLKKIQRQFELGSAKLLSFINKIELPKNNQSRSLLEFKTQIFKGISLMPYIQVFWDTGAGHSEFNSTRLPLIKNNQQYSFDFAKLNPMALPIKAIRIDPINMPSDVQINLIEWVDTNNNKHTVNTFTSNALTLKDQHYIFLTMDPQIEFILPSKAIIKKLNCEIHPTRINPSDLTEKIDSLQDAMATLALENQQLRIKLKFYNPKTYFKKIVLCLKHILNRF